MEDSYGGQGRGATLQPTVLRTGQPDVLFPCGIHIIEETRGVGSYVRSACLARGLYPRLSIFFPISPSLFAVLSRVEVVEDPIKQRFVASDNLALSHSISLSQSRATLCHASPPTMAIPKRALLLSSCALTFFSKKYAPGSPLTQGGFVKTVLALFAVQYFAQAFYRILIYPFFLSPLRHLPQPPVCCPPLL